MNRFKLAMMAVLLSTFSTGANAALLVEDFADPLGDWTSDWLYLNSNMENYYVASGTCDDNYRGNEPDGIWVSDDKGCGNIITQTPVTINIDSSIGDAATCFSLDTFACYEGGTLTVFDKDGNQQASTMVANDCYNLSYNYQFGLPNGISSFVFDSPGDGIEGNTSIDNVTLNDAAEVCPDILDPVVGEEPSEPVPANSSWALLALIAMLLGGVWLAMRRRSTPTI